MQQQAMEKAMEQASSCRKCADIVLIIQSNEQMIQEQCRLIKQMRDENTALSLKCVFLATENERLNFAESQRLVKLGGRLQQSCQTGSVFEDNVAKTDKMETTSTQLKESTRINAKRKAEAGSQNGSLLNKENLQTMLPAVSIRKDEEYFSRLRKNSYEQQHQASSWLKIINSPFRLKEETFKDKTVEFLKKFVPHDIRHVVWPAVQKNTLLISQELYFQLQERKNLGWVAKQVKSQIDKDVHRSFAGKNELSQKEGLKIEITQVLEMFHLYRPDVSYIQGMSYPVLVLTLVTGKVKAFRIFANLVLCNDFLRKLYTFESHFMLLATRAFQVLLFDYHPQVAGKLARQKIDPNIFLVEWFYTIFSRAFSFETTLKLWDHLLYFGEVVLYRIALSIMELIRVHIMETSYEDTIGLIQGCSVYVREDKLLELVLAHKLSHQKLWKTIDKFQKCLREQE